MPPTVCDMVDRLKKSVLHSVLKGDIPFKVCVGENYKKLSGTFYKTQCALSTFKEVIFLSSSPSRLFRGL